MSRKLGVCFVALFLAVVAEAQGQAVKPPTGFSAIFNGQDLTGWHGMKHFDPRKLAQLKDEDRKALLDKDTADAKLHWSVQNGELVNDGLGAYLTTDEEFGDVELLIDYKTVPLADSGIYLRATPQVQIWDWTNEKVIPLGADKGSGGLWNNTKGAAGKDPTVRADKPFGEWNAFRILQVGARTTVYLNGQLVVDHAWMENFWDKTKPVVGNGLVPLLKKGPIQLQTHGGEIRWRNIFLRKIGSDEANKILASKNDAGFNSIFNGKDLTGWTGAVDSYEIVDGAITGKSGKGGVLHTTETHSKYAVRLEFKLPPGGNNGLAIHYPGSGDAAFSGIELQVLDTLHEKYKNLKPWQVHGSLYGVVPAHSDYLRPTGEWNFEEVVIDGPHITVELNGYKILDVTLNDDLKPVDGKEHAGLKRTEGHFGFAGHSDPVMFRSIRLKKL